MKRGLTMTNPLNRLQRAEILSQTVGEVIFEPLYDTLTYPAAGTVGTGDLVFFSVGLGNGKTLSQTNMQLGGQMPAGQAFLVTGIQVAFYPADTIANATGLANYLNDFQVFSQNGSLDFEIGSKSYVKQAPLGKFPTAEHMVVDGALATTANEFVIQNAYNAGQEFSVLDMELSSSNNFSVTLRDLPPLPSDSDGRLVISLNGFKFRKQQ